MSLQPSALSPRVVLHDEWKRALLPEFSKPYMVELKRFLLAEKRQGKRVLPPGDEIFSALNLTPLSKVKVVIVGQDPYHGPNQAHGLSFSVKPQVPIPPSLANIYRELAADLNFQPPRHGYLVDWSRQGVLLLNAILTVEQHKAASHQNRGWETFTSRVLELLNDEREHLVFILWGAYAQKKGAAIDRRKHLVLTSPHPSPLSAHRGFFGSRPFSKANAYLRQMQVEPIDWQLPHTV